MDWNGVNGFILALGGLIAIVVPAILSVATFIRTGRLAAQQTNLQVGQAALAKSVDGQMTEMKTLIATSSEAKGLAKAVDLVNKANEEKALLQGEKNEREAHTAREALKAEGVASVDPIVDSVNKNSVITEKSADKMVAAIKGIDDAGKEKP